MNRMLRRCAAAVFLAAGIAVISAADGAKQTIEWRVYSADNRSTKYSPADQIDPNNIAQLRVAWRRP